MPRLADRPLARVHARDLARADAAVNRLRAAYRLDEAPLAPAEPVIERIAAAPPFHEGG